MAATETEFRIDEYLERERGKDLLRFSTAGSVDDGKSTLIGRLLYDTQAVYDDQLRAIEGKGTTAPGQIDFALLTDGLRAEREQGITIDVAYRYFSTSRRKFIIADTPGHEQYTRNMATGASTAEAAVVLIDASKGALVQSLRHAYIASLLRVGHMVVAVNKMDRIDYREEEFRRIEREFSRQLERIAADTGNPLEVRFVPVSALAGDNVVRRSEQMSWYDGPTLLGLLESLPATGERRERAGLRFPVQRVLRPNAGFRGFAGQIASGEIRRGDAVTILPAGTEAKVERIVTYDGDLEQAGAPLSVVLVLDREVDVSRGDMIVALEERPQIARHLRAALVWMGQRPLERKRRYLLKHASRTTPVYVREITNRVEIATLGREPAETLEMNAIGTVELELLRPIAFDPYRENRVTGAFVLIDGESNATVAAGMIHGAVEQIGESEEPFLYLSGPVTANERGARWGHRGALLRLTGPDEAIDAVERALFLLGIVAARVAEDDPLFVAHAGLHAPLAAWLARAGILAILPRSQEGERLIAETELRTIEVDAGDRRAAASAVCRLLEETGIVFETKGAGI